MKFCTDKRRGCEEKPPFCYEGGFLIFFILFTLLYESTSIYLEIINEDISQDKTNISGCSGYSPHSIALIVIPNILSYG